METYYTAVNFQIFIGVVLLLVLLLVFSAIPFFFRLPASLRFSTRGMVAAISTTALSRVCPYPGAARLLGLIGPSAAAFSLVLALLGGTQLYMSIRKGKWTELSPDEIDDQIVSFLAGRYLVIDPRGNILAGSLARLEFMPKPAGTAFPEYVKLLAGRYAVSRELRPFFDSLQRLENTEADLVSDKAYYRCRLSSLVEGGNEGFLFLVQDFTEEQRLLVRRDEQEKLAKLRVQRIRSQGEAEARSIRHGKAAGFVESFSKVVESGMEGLMDSLDKLAGHQIVLQDDINQALDQCSLTMNAIRELVHNIDTGEKTL